MGMWGEFREFAIAGNAMDLAVGVVIGAAFGKIVNSLVADVILPPFGLILGQVNFSDLYIDLSNKGYATMADAVKAGAPLIKYGMFVNNVIEFLIIAFAIFMVVKQINRFRTKPLEKLP